jgi:hypothetical protein
MGSIGRLRRSLRYRGTDPGDKKGDALLCIALLVPGPVFSYLFFFLIAKDFLDLVEEPPGDGMSILRALPFEFLQ